MNSLDALQTFCDRHEISLGREISRNSGSRFNFIRETNAKNMISHFVQSLLCNRIPICVSSGIDSDELSVGSAERFLEKNPSLQDQVIYATLTSGSTGHRKVILHSLEKSLNMAKEHASTLEMNSSTEVIQALPFHHSFGIVAFLLAPAVIQCRVRFTKEPLDWMVQRPSSESLPLIHLVPEMIRSYRQSELSECDGSVSIGAGLARKKDLDSLVKVGRKVFCTYGLTEAGPRVMAGRWSPDRPEGWVGQLLPSVHGRLSSDSGSLYPLLSLNTPFRGLNVECSSEGYLQTQDLFEQAEDGGYIFRGRFDESFKIRGRLYSVNEIRSKKENIGGIGPFALVLTQDHRILVHSAPKDQDRIDSMLKGLNLPVHQMIALNFDLRSDEMGKFPLDDLRKEIGIVAGENLFII